MSNFFIVTGTNSSGSAYHVLTDENFCEISPRVKYINYDEEKDMYLFRDKINIDEFVTGTLYYYVDSSKKVYNMAFIDIFDCLIDIKHNNLKDLTNNYQELKFKLGAHFREYIDNKKEHNLDAIKKLTLKK